MDSFPDCIKPENKQKFYRLRIRRFLSRMRTEIADLILKNDENEYYDLTSFFHRYSIHNEKNIQQELLSIIMKELSEKGWKTKTSYGGTALFIYSTEKPPNSCYEDGF